MKTSATALLLSFGILFAAGCDAPEDGSTPEEGQAVEAGEVGKADSPANFPSDFPGADTHCNGTFSSCDAEVAFSANRWGSLGVKIDETYRDGDQVVVRAFIQGPELTGVRARLHFAPERVSSLDEAEQVAITDINATRTRWGDGMEVEVITDIQGFMVDEGAVHGFFYVGFAGTEGTLRAIDADLD